VCKLFDVFSQLTASVVYATALVRSPVPRNNQLVVECLVIRRNVHCETTTLAYCQLGALPCWSISSTSHRLLASDVRALLTHLVVDQAHAFVESLCKVHAEWDRGTAAPAPPAPAVSSSSSSSSSTSSASTSRQTNGSAADAGTTEMAPVAILSPELVCKRAQNFAQFVREDEPR
jgi:hypothetical protein